MHRKWKKIILVACLITVLVTFLIIIKTSNSKDLKGDIKINVDSSNYYYIKSAAEEFSKKNRNVKIEVDEKSHQEMINYLEEDKKDGVDLITLNSKEVRSLSHKAIENIDTSNMQNYIKEFGKARFNEIKIGNRYLGIPIQNNPQFLIIREDILNTYGYKSEDIRTWKELINIVLDIRSKGSGDISLLSYGNIIMEDLTKLMIYQGASTTEVQSLINEIRNNNLLSGGTPIIYVANKNNYNDISLKNRDKTLSISMIPAINIGENRAVSFEGDNIIGLKSNYDKENITKAFMKFIVENQKIIGDRMVEGEAFFPSSKTFYNNILIDTSFKNINNKKVWSLMANISNRSPEIESYINVDTSIRSVK